MFEVQGLAYRLPGGADCGALAFKGGPHAIPDPAFALCLVGRTGGSLLLNSSARKRRPKTERSPSAHRCRDNLYSAGSKRPLLATDEVVSKHKLPDGSIYVVKSSSLIARDSKGRTYSEVRHFVPETSQTLAPIEIIVISDPVSGLSTYLSTATHEAKQYSIRKPPHPFPDLATPEEKNGDPRVHSTEIGDRDYEGLHLRGTRIWGIGGVVNDYWYSPELSIHVITEFYVPTDSGGSGDALTQTITKIDRHEPDPSLFTIPTGYNVVDNRQALRKPGVYLTGNGVTGPELIHSEIPQYTAIARQATGPIRVTSTLAHQTKQPWNFRSTALGLGSHSIQQKA